MIKEFKEFIARGNVMDLAVGVIIGAAFGKIVTSLVDDILMPVIGLAAGKVNFADKFVSLNGESYPSLAAAKAAGAATMNYGTFINTIVQFLIVAFVIFLIVRAVNNLKRPAETPKETPNKQCPFCFSDIPEPASRCPQCTSDLRSAAPAAG